MVVYDFGCGTKTVTFLRALFYENWKCFDVLTDELLLDL
jgi:hypothetical protein